MWSWRQRKYARYVHNNDPCLFQFEVLYMSVTCIRELNLVFVEGMEMEMEQFLVQEKESKNVNLVDGSRYSCIQHFHV